MAKQMTGIESNTRTGSEQRTAFDDLLNLDPPVTPATDSNLLRLRRIRAQIERGTYLTEERVAGAINAMCRRVTES